MQSPSVDPKTLQELLHRYNEYPEERDSISADIDARFRREFGILVLDSSGFSRTTREQGIIHFLALLERLARIVLPLIERGGGRLLRREADNIFALFPDARSMVATAVDIVRGVDLTNVALPARDELYVAIGVGYGSALFVEPDDLFGDEMNVACKLGEDLAQRGEILLTEAAYRALGEGAPWTFEEVEFSVSGLDLSAYRWRP